MSWFSILVLAVAVLGAGSTLAVQFLTGVPALPTSPRVLGAVLALAERVPRRAIVDLGSGYGTLVLALARRHPRARVVGYEVSPVPYLVSRVRLWIARLPNAEVRYGNLFDADLGGVDLVLAYLTRRPMQRLQVKLEQQLGAGAELICHTFALPGWKELERLVALDLYHTPVYRYPRPKPARPAVRHPWMERPRRPGVQPSGLLDEPPAAPDEPVADDAAGPWDAEAGTDGSEPV